MKILKNYHLSENVCKIKTKFPSACPVWYQWGAPRRPSPTLQSVLAGLGVSLLGMMSVGFHTYMYAQRKPFPPARSLCLKAGGLSWSSCFFLMYFFFFNSPSQHRWLLHVADTHPNVSLLVFSPRSSSSSGGPPQYLFWCS